MVIFELGIVNNGVPIISKQYYKEHNMAVSPILRAGFLSALNSFAEEAFADSVESFTMKNFKIVILSRLLRKFPPLDVIAYTIGDKKLKLKVAKSALTRILDEFIKQYGYLEDLSVNLTIFNDFLQVFDDILGDLAKKPDDRLKSIFG
ncbi:MAG: hypothetical protein HWN66_12190 [Candidatus Helarchaeota archaeon]|nr:hypothetical protein [Candidatus Helarchaeota archaeon]